MTDLWTRSVKLILDSQAETGAYPAATSYPTYGYSWFRDGAYIAHAMDLAGEGHSATRFHGWVAQVVTRRAERIDEAVNLRRFGEPLMPRHHLHTRYTLEGDDGTTDWPNFQLDGFGTWLWSVHRHLEGTGEPMPAEWATAVDLVADYIASLWDQPCYDCWEEFPDEVHTHTLAAVHGGLTAHQLLSGRDHEPTLNAIRERLDREAITQGRFTKYLGATAVDASLVGLVTPYRVVDPDEPPFVATMQTIEGALRRDGGGPHRYAADSFYGGGEWVVLAGWLGWHHAEVGDQEEAHRLLEWVEAQADPEGYLPEQVPLSLNVPNQYQVWVDRWGPIACPLLWSHANYLILHHHLYG